MVKSKEEQGLETPASCIFRVFYGYWNPQRLWGKRRQKTVRKQKGKNMLIVSLKKKIIKCENPQAISLSE